MSRHGSDGQRFDETLRSDADQAAEAVRAMQEDRRRSGDEGGGRASSAAGLAMLTPFLIGQDETADDDISASATGGTTDPGGGNRPTIEGPNNLELPFDLKPDGHTAIMNGAWEIVNSRLQLTTPAAAAPFGLLLYRQELVQGSPLGANYTNVDVSARLYNISGLMGLIAHANFDDGTDTLIDGHLFIVNSAGQWKLRVYAAGVPTDVATGMYVDHSDGDLMRMRWTNDGSDYELSFNGEVQAAASSVGPQTGYCGAVADLAPTNGQWANLAIAQLED